MEYTFNSHNCSLASFDFLLEKTATDKNPKQNFTADKHSVATQLLSFS